MIGVSVPSDASRNTCTGASGNVRPTQRTTASTALLPRPSPTWAA